MGSMTIKLRPLFRPFVIRPALWMSAASLGLTLSYFAVWDSIFLVLGNAAWAGPAVFAALPLLLLVARAIAYRGTDYTIAKDHIVIRHGGVFGDRSIELDLVNITLVEWRSPYLLKLFYGVGHLVIREAGNAQQNARMVYLEQPERIYRLIAQNMRDRGFSMQRNARISQQRSGVLGAFVDMAGFALGLAYTVVVVADTLLLAFGKIAANIAASLRPLVAQVESTEFIASVFVFALSGLLLLAGVVWMAFKFLELSRRTLTLHDDVVDFYQGFLSEKRQYIPLENLTDTDLSRPLYKRVLGLSDLRLSARGSGNSLVFNSMPGAEAFARALEQQLDKMSARNASARAAQAQADVDVEAESTPPAPGRTETFKPEVWRAALGSLLNLLVFPLVIFAGMGLFAALGALGVENLGAIGAAIFGAIAIWGGIWLVSTLFGIGRSVLFARATEYSFDTRRARKTFDFLNHQETKFASEQITSFSILTNPIDRAMGTMTLRLRSIGSAQTLDFRHVAHSPYLIEALEQALGFAPPGAPSEATELIPTYTLLDGIKAHLAGYLGALATLMASGVIIGILLEELLLFLVMGLGLFILGSLINIAWHAMRVSRLRATLGTHTLTVAGGILNRYRHHTALAAIKGVSSLQYPASSLGALNIATGGGFTMSVDFLPAIRMQHERLDSRILGRRVAQDTPNAPVEFGPTPSTALLRHLAWCIVCVIFIPTLPATLGWVALRTRRTRYRIENERVLVELPLIYHRRTSVLYERIDHLETRRDMANKLCGTRDVEVYTVGSATVDLQLRGLADHEGAVAVIRARMAGG